MSNGVLIVCGLFDTKAEIFLQPFFVRTLGVAYRDLQSQLARPGDENTLRTYARDFELYQLGTFDTESGRMDTMGFPKMLLTVSSLVVDGSDGLPEARVFEGTSTHPRGNGGL